MLAPFPNDRQPFSGLFSRHILTRLVNAANTALGIHVARDRTAGIGDTRIQRAGVQIDSAGGALDAARISQAGLSISRANGSSSESR